MVGGKWKKHTYIPRVSEGTEGAQHVSYTENVLAVVTVKEAFEFHSIYCTQLYFALFIFLQYVYNKYGP